MELDELRLILKNSGVDLWGLIDTAISVAILDHGNELRSRRDAIVERLYAPLLCNNSYSDEIPKSIERIIDDHHKLKTEENSTVDYEEDLEISKIITIKNHFEISNQVSFSVVLSDLIHAPKTSFKKGRIVKEPRFSARPDMESFFFLVSFCGVS